MNIRALFAVTLLLAAASVQSVELKYGSIDPADLKNDNAIIISGEIRKGDYDALLRFARKDPIRFNARTIVLASQGGDLLEAIRIGTFIRKTYMSVFVNPAIGRCASACFLIYVAAIERSSIPPSLGIHRPYFTTSDVTSLSAVERNDRRLMQAVRNYLDEQQVPLYLIEKMFSLASTEIYWLSWEDLGNLGVRANWWDQVLVDRCGLDKKLEQEYLDQGGKAMRAEEARKQIHDVAVCSYEISTEARFQNLNKLLRAPK